MNKGLITKFMKMLYLENLELYGICSWPFFLNCNDTLPNTRMNTFRNVMVEQVQRVQIIGWVEKVHYVPGSVQMFSTLQVLSMMILYTREAYEDGGRGVGIRCSCHNNYVIILKGHHTSESADMITVVGIYNCARLTKVTMMDM